MANNDYEIYHSNKRDKITVKENVIDNDSIPLALVGHGQPNYGLAQNTNFLHLLENFASDGSDDEPEPEHPVVGQLWFKNLGGGKFELNVCSELKNGTPVWVELLQNIKSASGTYPEGTLYYDPKDKKLKVWDASEGDGGGWISVGPSDIVHTNHTFASMLVDQGAEKYSYEDFDMSYVNDNIKETGGRDIEGNGALSLVKMTILAKEFSVIGAGTITPADTAKCCVWIYKFVVRSVKSSESNNTVNIVGAPNYELVAQNPQDLDWRVDIHDTVIENEPRIVVDFEFNTKTSNYITIGIDTEITRI